MLFFLRPQSQIPLFPRNSQIEFNIDNLRAHRIEKVDALNGVKLGDDVLLSLRSLALFEPAASSKMKVIGPNMSDLHRVKMTA